jgi:hypothetical protein
MAVICEEGLHASTGGGTATAGKKRKRGAQAAYEKSAVIIHTAIADRRSQAAGPTSGMLLSVKEDCTPALEGALPLQARQETPEKSTCANISL